MKRTILMLAGLTLLLGSVGPARAQFTTYTDYPTWSGAVSGPITTVTIPDPSPNQYIDIGSNGSSVTYSGVTFTQYNGTFYNVGVLFSGYPATLTSAYPNGGPTSILITFPSAVSAFGLNYSTDSGNDVTFTLSNGDNFTLGSSASYYDLTNFAGATDTTPFTSVLVSSGDPIGLNLNNVSYVPEPSGFALFGLSIVCLAVGYVVRRRTLAPTAA